MFSKEDFTQPVATQLTVIIMKQMEKKPLTPYFSLEPSQKKKFNRLMNEYIVSLGEEWKDKLEADFNLIVNEDILNESFDPTTTYIKEINTQPEMMLSPEQEQWIKEETEAGRPPKL
jgi:hypothetical protein